MRLTKLLKYYKNILEKNWLNQLLIEQLYDGIVYFPSLSLKLSASLLSIPSFQPCHHRLHHFYRNFHHFQCPWPMHRNLFEMFQECYRLLYRSPN